MLRPSTVCVAQVVVLWSSSFFFFSCTATTEIYTLSLHDALPISLQHRTQLVMTELKWCCGKEQHPLKNVPQGDRKSTRLNSSHRCISYAVFCLKKKRHTGVFESLLNIREKDSNMGHPQHSSQTNS